jgi:mannan endo-1,4-beta-mannosidase
MINFYLQWQPVEPLKPSLDAIWKAGAVPCITWEPMGTSFESIIRGDHDAYILAFADEVKHFNRPLILRFAHEMNLKSYHWGTTESAYGAQSPVIYVEMFRHIVDIFKKENIHNALFAFCPNANSIPEIGWNQVHAYYPGNAYVDILGMDGYNWNITDAIAKERNLTWNSPWMSFEQIFEPLYRELKQIAKDKPIIVFETGTASRVAQKKGAWIRDAQKTAWKWGLEGIIWFQINKEEDWRMNQEEDIFVPSTFGSFQERVEEFAKELK